MSTRLSAIPGLPPLLACLGLLAVWELAAYAFDISGLPPAHEALRELPAILTDPESLLNILASIERMAIGFALGLAFAIPVGLMMGRSRFTAAFFNPLLMIIYPVPKAALMPIIMRLIEARMFSSASGSVRIVGSSRSARCAGGRPLMSNA